MRVLLLMVAYFLVGKAPQLLIPQPGPVPPVWPAAGLALAAVPACGPGVIPRMSRPTS